MLHDGAASPVVAVARRFVPGSGPVDVRALGAGLVNETYRVLRDGTAYGLRIAAAGGRSLGRDPPWELRVLAVAAAAGVAPAVVHHDLEAGVLVTRWAPGGVWDEAQTRVAGNLERMAMLLRRVHGLTVPEPQRRMAPADWMNLYERALDDYAESAATRSRPLRADACTWRAHFDALPSLPAVLCHSDLHALNVLDSTPQLTLLDWEYAHLSEPFWDTAAWISNNDLEQRSLRALLAAYAGRAPTVDEQRRQALLCWAFDYVCLLWSEMYLQVRGRAAAVDARADRLARRLTTRPWS